MKRVLLCTMFIMVLVCCEGSCLIHENFFKRQIDSLDAVQPQAILRYNKKGKEYEIKIQSQQQFEHIGNNVLEALHKGQKNIVVKISRGIYQFHENHLLLTNVYNDEVSLTIVGDNTIITSDEDKVRNNDYSSFWGKMHKAESLIEVVDEKTKLCRIPYKITDEELGVNVYKKVQITQWYKAPIYEIERVDNDGVYFIAPKLKYIDNIIHKGYNVNYDYLYGGVTPRFRLFKKKGERNEACCFLNVENSSFKSLVLKNISFKGNKEDMALISVKNFSSSQTMICHCEFNYIRGPVLGAINTNNLSFEKNKILNTYGNEVSFSGGCNNIRVTGNKFENCGLGLGNTFCVKCNECEYYIADNTFCDFGYSAIGVGVWHGSIKKYHSRGIIEHNEIFYTPTYYSESWKHTLMDSGAIYTWTQNDDVIIRYNYIHDYTGIRSNRGVFCDDGASNIKIYGNLIVNISNSHTIDSRKINDQNPILRNNSNNFIANNILQGTIRFNGYDKENRHCVKGTNIFLNEKEKMLVNKLSNLEKTEEDRIITDFFIQNGKVGVSSVGKKIINELITDDYIWSFIK